MLDFICIQLTFHFYFRTFNIDILYISMIDNVLLAILYFPVMSIVFQIQSITNTIFVNLQVTRKLSFGKYLECSNATEIHNKLI